MWRSIRLSLIALMIALAAPTASDARIARPLTLQELVLFSDVIASAHVTSATTARVNDEVCGTRYTAKIEQVFKGKRIFDAGDPLRFGRSRGLEVGQTYLVFLRGYADVNAFYDEYVRDVRDQFVEDDDTITRFIRCEGIIPGYEYINASLEIEGAGIAVEKLRAEGMPSFIGIVSADRHSVIFSKSDLYFYLSGREKPSPFDQRCEDCAVPAATIPDAIRVRRNGEPV